MVEVDGLAKSLDVEGWNRCQLNLECSMDVSSTGWDKRGEGASTETKEDIDIILWLRFLEGRIDSPRVCEGVRVEAF